MGVATCNQCKSDALECEAVSDITRKKSRIDDTVESMPYKHNVPREHIHINVKLSVDRGNIPKSNKSAENDNDSSEASTKQILARSLTKGCPNFVPIGSLDSHFSNNGLSSLLTMKRRSGAAGLQKKLLNKEVENPLRAVSFAYDAKYLVLEKKCSLLRSYELISILGKGAYGKVLKVQHKLTGKCYALKIIHRKCCVSNVALLKEIEILKNLVYFPL